MNETDSGTEPGDLRTRVLEAAAKLIATGGIAALTTRAVASAASIQPPTLYRLFGEKRGLLEAVAEHGLASFVAQKTAAVLHPDPVQDLIDAWDAYIAFGRTNPAVFAIMNDIGASSPPSQAAVAGIEILRARVLRIARAGRLRIPVEQAITLVHAVGVGTVATLLAAQSTTGDPQLASLARDAVLTAILTDAPRAGNDDIASLAIALGARMDAIGNLTPGERLLLSELLGRLAADAASPT